VTSKRIIPQFLLSGTRLVKGTRFSDFIDVGDPVSQAMIYDAQGADEVILVDINASAEHRIIDTRIIGRMIEKCRLPITIGGGIRSVDDAVKCFAAGADKIVINTHVADTPGLVEDLADEFGSQSVVVSIDVKKKGNGEYSVHVLSGRKPVSQPLDTYLGRVIGSGAGEVLITSIDREGTLTGFDLPLYQHLGESLPVSLIGSGGAGCYDDIVALFSETSCDACTLGKMLFLRDYDIVRIKSYLTEKGITIRDA
jgi:imidazole glycerol-phosphate synthase subunit HisF